jgi:hypothetical protein
MLWDLKTAPPTWDFGIALVCAKTAGVERVHFRYEGEVSRKKLSEELYWHRFKNIITPLCDLAKTPWVKGPGGEGMTFGYHAGDLEKVFKEHGRIWKYTTTYRAVGKKRRYVTVTIRESFRNMERNSNRPAWNRFISDLEKKSKVIVLEDRELDPIPVSERMSLYAHADMNYGVNNGPMALLYCSESPYTVFNMIPRANPDPWREHMEKGGFPVGSQFSFRNERQKIVWESDDYEVLSREL